MQIRAQQLRALDIIPSIQFLINTVCRIRATPHRQQQDILARRLLERDSHGDTAAFPRHIRLGAEDLLHGLGGGAEIPVFGRSDPPLAVVLAGDG